MSVATRPAPTLDAFVSWYHGRAGSRAVVADEVAALFAPVTGARFDDADLRELLAVCHFATRFWRPERVMQTGTFVGATTAAIALALERNGGGELHTIDPEPPAYFGVANPVDIARKAVGESRLSPLVTFHRAYSTMPLDLTRLELVSAPAWRLKHLARRFRWDVLVVDGDHTGLGCLLDLVYGSAGFAAGGPRVAIVHDYLGIDGVRQAVRRFVRRTGCTMKVVPSRCGIALLQLDQAGSGAQMFRRGEG